MPGAEWIKPGACNEELKGKVLEDLSLVYSFPEPLTTYSIFLILLLII
jgi:hypothetical protein